MASNDRITCPLCCGLGWVPADPNVQQKVARALTELTKPQEEEAATVSTGQPTGNFDRDVHSWNPAQPMWRRSPKE